MFWQFLIGCGYLFCELLLGSLPWCAMSCNNPWAKTSYSTEKGRQKSFVPLLKFFSHSFLLPVNSDMYRQLSQRLSVITISSSFRCKCGCCVQRLCSSDWSSFVLVRSWQEDTQNELKAWWDVHQHGWYSSTRTGGKRPHLAPRKCLVVSEIIYIYNKRLFPQFTKLGCCYLNVKCC